MNDMSVVSHALEDSEEAEGSGSINGFLLQGLQSSDSSTRTAAVETLHESLLGQDGSSSLSRRDTHTSILEDAALEYIPTLLQILPESQSQVEELLLLIAELSTPKEVLFALEVALQQLANQAEKFDVSDGEDSEEEEDMDKEGDGRAMSEWIGQLRVIVACLTKVIPRLPLKKCTPTLFTISDALYHPLRMLIPHTSPLQAPKLLSGLSALVEQLWIWSQTKSDHRGEQRSICLDILQLSIALCGTRLDGVLSSRWFLRVYARYGELYPKEEMKLAESGLTHARSVYLSLGQDSKELVNTLRQTRPQGPHAPIAALILAAHAMISSKLSTDLLDSLVLEDIRPILVLAICDPTGGGLQDAGLTVAWAVCNHQTSIDDDTAEGFIEVLMPVTAGNPDKTTRFSCFKLINELVLKCKTHEGKLRCLTILLEAANPYEQLRERSIGIFLDVIIKLPEAEGVTLFFDAMDRLPDLRQCPTDLTETPRKEESNKWQVLISLLSAHRVLATRIFAANNDYTRRFIALDLEHSLLGPAQNLFAIKKGELFGGIPEEISQTGGLQIGMLDLQRLADETSRLAVLIASMKESINL